MTNHDRIRTGIIGYGLSGQVFHAPFIRNHPAYDLTAVSTRDAEMVQSTLPGVNREANAASLIARNDIDLVIVTAPNEFHYSLCRDALQGGKHVLVEKPAVTRVAELDELIALAGQQNRVFTVYQNRRYDGDFLHLKSVVESRSLGTLKLLDSRYDRFRPEPRDRWREQNVVGGGIFWDLGPHLIDQVLTLLGRPSSVSGNLLTLREGAGVTDAFEVQLHYSDCFVTLGSNPFAAGTIRRFRAGFSGGTWQCKGLDPQESLLRAGAQPESAGWAHHSDSWQLSETATGQSTRGDTVSPGDYQHFFSQLADAIRNHGLPPVNSAEARQLIEIMERIELASASARTVSVG